MRFSVKQLLLVVTAVAGILSIIVFGGRENIVFMVCVTFWTIVLWFILSLPKEQ